MVAIVGAYVEGRPIPSRSSSLMSDASVYRDGGVVSCRFGSVPSRVIAVDPSRVDAIADSGLRQNRFLIFELGRRIVAAFDVGATEARKLDRLAARRQDDGLAARPLRRNLDGRPQDARVHHLRRHRALPDQLVDLQVVGIEHAFELRGREPEIGRPNRFVRFLRVLDLASDTAVAPS